MLVRLLTVSFRRRTRRGQCRAGAFTGASSGNSSVPKPRTSEALANHIVVTIKGFLYAIALAGLWLSSRAAIRSQNPVQQGAAADRRGPVLGVIERIVVEDRGEVILVCRSQEFEAAQGEGREPISVGFKRSDILESSP